MAASAIRKEVLTKNLSAAAERDSEWATCKRELSYRKKFPETAVLHETASAVFVFRG
jgi:hypothetical protein